MNVKLFYEDPILLNSPVFGVISKCAQKLSSIGQVLIPSSELSSNVCVLTLHSKFCALRLAFDILLSNV